MLLLPISSSPALQLHPLRPLVPSCTASDSVDNYGNAELCILCGPQLNNEAELLVPKMLSKFTYAITQTSYTSKNRYKHMK